ncbi:hypothetical protein, partial [Bacillus cereus]|uniref:hypothetical protein n=1 Tax=Bacillus cereus TaxID=1396 RepID=UPI001C5509D0
MFILPPITSYADSTVNVRVSGVLGQKAENSIEESSTSPIELQGTTILNYSPLNVLTGCLKWKIPANTGVSTGY